MGTEIIRRIHHDLDMSSRPFHAKGDSGTTICCRCGDPCDGGAFCENGWDLETKENVLRALAFRPRATVTAFSIRNQEIVVSACA